MGYLVLFLLTFMALLPLIALYQILCHLESCDSYKDLLSG